MASRLKSLGYPVVDGLHVSYIYILYLFLSCVKGDEIRANEIFFICSQ